MMVKRLAGALTALAALCAPMVVAPAAMAGEVSELGVPIHSRSVKDNGDGTYDLTYQVNGKSNPSVVHLGGDVVTTFDNSGSMSSYAQQVADAASKAEAKALAAPNTSLPANQQNRGAFGSYDGLSSMGGKDWTNDPKVFAANAHPTGGSSSTSQGLDTIAKAAADSRKDGGDKVAVLIGMFDYNSGDELEKMEKLAKDGWEWRIVSVNKVDDSGKNWVDALKKAGYEATYYEGVPSIAKLYDEIGRDQSTAWRVGDVSVVDEFGPYVDPVDVSKLTAMCTDRKEVDPGEDTTGCSTSADPKNITASWDGTSRKLTISFPDKSELGAKAQYDITLKVKVNEAGVTHYEDNGYKYDGVKGATGTGDTAGTEGFPVSKDDKSSQLRYTFHRNGEAQGGERTTPYALPVIHVGKLESTLTYDANGGDGSMPSQTGEHDTNVEASENTFTRKGYRFVTWNTMKDGSGKPVKPGDPVKLTAKTQTLYAQWTEKPATLSYDRNADAATGTVDRQEGLDGDTITVAQNAFEWAGRTFTGWNTAKDGSGDTFQPGDQWTLKEGDTILYAQWVADPSTIAYLPGTDRATGETPSQSGLVDETVKVADNGFTWTGHTFLGWKVADNTDNTDTDKSDNDGTADDDTQTDPDKTPADTTSPDRTESDADNPDTTPTGGATTRLSADRTDDTDPTTGGDQTGETPTDGAESGDTATDTTSPDKTVTSPDETGDTATSGEDDPTGADKPDETGGDADQSGLIRPGDERKLTVDGETLVAVWRANTYTVKFDANGDGTVGSMQPQSFTYDEKGALTRNAYSRVGWNWLTWNLKPDGSGDKYADGATVENLTAEDGAAVTLYAQWERIPLPQTGVAFAGVGLAVFGLLAAGGALTVGSRRRSNR